MIKVMMVMMVAVMVMVMTMIMMMMMMVVVVVVTMTIYYEHAATCFKMLSPVRKRGSEPVSAWQSIACEG